MLARYRIIRGVRPPDDPLPDGLREDTRKHTRHVLRPTDELVRSVLETAGEPDWRAFAAGYRALLEQRFGADPAPFERLAAAAREGDVHLGCNCPTNKQPDVRRCHTWTALGFMRDHFPDLDVRFP